MNPIIKDRFNSDIRMSPFGARHTGQMTMAMTFPSLRKRFGSKSELGSWSSIILFISPSLICHLQIATLAYRCHHTVRFYRRTRNKVTMVYTHDLARMTTLLVVLPCLIVLLQSVNYFVPNKSKISLVKTETKKKLTPSTLGKCFGLSTENANDDFY
jgi:hypothetical protein